MLQQGLLAQDEHGVEVIGHSLQVVGDLLSEPLFFPKVQLELSWDLLVNRYVVLHDGFPFRLSDVDEHVCIGIVLLLVLSNPSA